MSKRKKFPLVFGFLSLDLVNTEVIAYGRRRELLTREQDLLDWLHTMCKKNSSLDKTISTISESELTEILNHIYDFRFLLRKNFESIADGAQIDNNWILSLEKNIENAPFTYKLEGKKLIQIPKGSMIDRIFSLISLDALQLITAGKLQKIKRCSNPDCPLLFIDTTSRRKWCSMEICGNRQKLARFQNKKNKS
jgi:predicted RNA-binding Zn ribbon-like protein